MTTELKGKKVFISGSSSGIGLQIAQTFSNAGCKVGINGRNLNKLKKIKKDIPNSEIFLSDVYKKKNFFSLKNKLKKKFKKIDYLICNVGNSSKEKNHLDIENAFKNNFFSSINLIQSLDGLINKNGRIICISSICGVEYIEGAPYGYSIAKSALNSYVKCMSRFYSERNITINAIAPGNIIFKNSVWDKKMKENKNKVNKFINTDVPLKRFGIPIEISSICLYLCTKNAEFINGSIIRSDGGQSKSF